MFNFIVFEHYGRELCYVVLLLRNMLLALSPLELVSNGQQGAALLATAIKSNCMDSYGEMTLLPLLTVYLSKLFPRVSLLFSRRHFSLLENRTKCSLTHRLHVSSRYVHFWLQTTKPATAKLKVLKWLSTDFACDLLTIKIKTLKSN